MATQTRLWIKAHVVKKGCRSSEKYKIAIRPYFIRVRDNNDNGVKRSIFFGGFGSVNDKIRYDFTRDSHSTTSFPECVLVRPSRR